MDPSLRKELQIRARVDTVFNKILSDFDSPDAHNDYLEEKEDLVWAFLEGGAAATEAEEKLARYRREHADEIVRNEARLAEGLRAKAEAEARAGEAGLELAGVSGTAAAFEGGTRPEPHGSNSQQEYTARLAPGSLGLAQSAGVGRLPVALSTERLADGDIRHEAARDVSKERWEAMAVCSGWTPEIPRRRAVEEAFQSILSF